MQANVYLDKTILMALDAAHQDALNRSDQSKRHASFEHALTMLAIPAYREKANRPNHVFSHPQDAKVLVPYLLYYYEDHLRRSFLSYQKSDIEIFFKVLCDNNLVHDVVGDVESARTIASLCLSVVFNNIQWGRSADGSITQSLVERWIGHPVAPEQLNNTQSMVDLLYGPVVWEMYGRDVTEDDGFELPYELWRLQVPLAQQLTAKMTESNGVTPLPGDLV